MDRTFFLKYGERDVEIPIQGAHSIQVLQENPMKEIEDLRAAFYKAVEQEPIDSLPLSQLIGKDDLVTLVVSDITRAWMHQDQIVEPLVSFLHETCKVPYAHMVILIALGTHRPNTEEEMKQIVSPAVYENVQVINHNCDAPDLVYVGTTSRGPGRSKSTGGWAKSHPHWWNCSSPDGGVWRGTQKRTARSQFPA